MLEEARTMDPRNEIILFDLARTNYFAQKRYADATAIAESVLAWKPESFHFHLTRAKVDLASRADVRRWREVIWGEPARAAEADLLTFERLELALTERDYAAAEAALTASKLPEFNWAGYITPQHWYQGLIANGRGDRQRAQACFAAARETVAAIVAQRPDDAKAQIILAEIEARLGQKAEAIAAGERALALRPVARDAVDGPNIMYRLAGVYAQLGETARALDLLEAATRMPVATNYGALKLEETWDPLRGQPRFEAIVAGLGPKENAR
jgi:serine/threonine-protein kinase